MGKYSTIEYNSSIKEYVNKISVIKSSKEKDFAGKANLLAQALSLMSENFSKIQSSLNEEWDDEISMSIDSNSNSLIEIINSLIEPANGVVSVTGNLVSSLYDRVNNYKIAVDYYNNMCGNEPDEKIVDVEEHTDPENKDVIIPATYKDNPTYISYCKEMDNYKDKIIPQLQADVEDAANAIKNSLVPGAKEVSSIPSPRVTSKLPIIPTDEKKTTIEESALLAASSVPNDTMQPKAVDNSYTEEELKELANLGYGTFTLETFKASNGKRIQYYVYVPKCDDTTGLPVMLYVHGGATYGTSEGDWRDYGLCKKIADKEITPNGIIVLPYVVDFEGESGNQYREGIKELTDTVVEKYHADKDRISLSGHSYGAITCYKLIGEYPNYFSACVPISGWENNVNTSSGAFKNIKLWAFHGKNDDKKAI